MISSTTSAARWRRPASRWWNSWLRMPRSPSISRGRNSTGCATPQAISASPARWWTRCWRGNRARRVERRATRLRYVAAHSLVTTALLTFRLVAARVIVVTKPGGNHDHAIACRRIRDGASMRQFGVPHRHAGAGLSVAPHHHDRAVRCRRSDRYARSAPRRAHAAVARPGHRHRERDRRRVDDRCRPCRAGVARRLYAGAGQLDELRGVWRALPDDIRLVGGLRAGVAAHLRADVDRRKEHAAGQ